MTIGPEPMIRIFLRSVRGGARLELGVELSGDEVRVRRQFDDLHELAVGRKAAYLEPGRLEPLARLAVVGELVAVAVALGDFRLAV